MNVRRRDILRSAPFAVPGLARAAAPAASIAGMNVILFLTDQTPGSFHSRE